MPAAGAVIASKADIKRIGLNQVSMDGFPLLVWKWMAVVSRMVAKRFWLLPPKYHLDKMDVGRIAKWEWSV